MKINLDTNLITSLVSSNPCRIRFPYDWQNSCSKEDFLWAVKEIMCNNGADLEEIADINIYAMLRASRFRIGGGFEIEVTTTDGKTLSKRIAATTNAEEVSAILKHFFNAAAPGLKEEYRMCFDRQYYEYLQAQSSRKSSMMLRALENGLSVDSVIALAAQI